MDKLKKFFADHREIILYIFFGVLTTLVGFGSYFIFLKIGRLISGIGEDEPSFYIIRTIAQILQWVLAVLFAYVTNRKWVFNSRASGARAICRELLLFSGSRVATLLLDTAVTFCTVALLELFHYQTWHFIFNWSADFIAKIVASVLVVIANYVLSKVVVFRNNSKKKD